MRDQYTRERVLAVLMTVMKRKRFNPITVAEIQKEIVKMMNYHQAIERRAIYRDLEAIEAVGLPIKIHRGKNNRLLAFMDGGMT